MDQSTPVIKHYAALVKTNPFENYIEKFEETAESVISHLDLNIVKKYSQLFTPQGVTLIYILAESHFVIHTWPESGIFYVDMVTCSLRTEREFENSLKYAFIDYNPFTIKVKSVDFDKL